MSKKRKVIVKIALFFLLVLDLFIIFNIDNYFKILNLCFNKEIYLSRNFYVLICTITCLISILIFISVKLVVENKNDEIKGVKLKLEDGTYGTANWMSNEELNKILGVIDIEEYRINIK